MRPAVRRKIGIGAGLVLGVALLAVLLAPGYEQLHAPGPANAGHDEIACDGCHRPARGTMRQQLQNAVRHGLGLRAVEVDIGFRAVTNEECVACHDRPDDRHPVFRFLEPRFAEARARLRPEQCVACHAEHRGVRVTVAELTYCRECHADLRLANDPLDVAHRELAEEARWDTCLGCHDYHGNHALEPPLRLEDRISPDVLRRYLQGGPSPYGDPILRATRPEASTL